MSSFKLIMCHVPIPTWSSGWKVWFSQLIWFNIPTCLKRIQTQSLETSICGGFAVDLPKHPINIHATSESYSQPIHFPRKVLRHFLLFLREASKLRGNWKASQLVFSCCHVYANDCNLVTVWTAYSNLTYWFLRRVWIDQSLIISPSRWKW